MWYICYSAMTSTRATQLFLASHKISLRKKVVEFVSFSDQSQPRRYRLHNVTTLHSSVLDIKFYEYANLDFSQVCVDPSKKKILQSLKINLKV